MAGKGTITETAGQELNTRECCMCGDLGFSDQLFQCKICQFRSQHRYCSNLYPKTEYSGTCNWCLSHHHLKLEDTKDQKSPNSSNNSSSSSQKNNNDGITLVNDESNKRRLKKGLIRGIDSSSSISIGLQPIKKKQKAQEEKSSPKSSPTPSPSVVTSTRKRIVTNGALEDRLRRTRSEDIIANRRRGVASSANGTTTRFVFRNKKQEREEETPITFFISDWHSGRTKAIEFLLL